MGTSPEHLLPSPNNQTSVVPRQPQTILQSWKEIASELNRGVRTVQRWEQTLGLPVHRLGKGPRCPVFAFKDELSLWFRNNARVRELEPTESSLDPARAERRYEQPVISVPNGDSRAKPHFSKGRKPTGTTSKARASILRSIDHFFAECSRRKHQRCKECRSVLRFLEGRFSLFGTETLWRVPIPYCPVCDGHIVGAGKVPMIN
jgi:hypothetical protein